MDEIKKFQQFFETDQGDKCLARLVLHAGNHLRRYQGRIGLDLGLSPEDAVNEAICRVLDGTRKWDSERVPSIKTFLKWVIRSVIDHSFDNLESTQTTRFSEDCEGNEYIPPLTKSEVNEYTESIQTRTPEELILSENEFTEFNARILASLVEHPELEDLALCFMEGVSKPQEIATELGISISEVNNRQKRLKRILRKIYNKP